MSIMSSTTFNANPNRNLDWPACYNVRDLGGLPTVDGGTTRWRAVIRSDIPARLTAEGRQALIDYGVRTIIDLREPNQTVEEPSIFMTPTGAANEPVYLNRQLETRQPHVSALIEKGAQRPDFTRADVYNIILDHYPELFAEAMRAIASARPGGVLIHCHGGKDRTGTICALLLGLAGVPDDVIAADYAESQVCLWPLWEEIIAKVGGEENADFWLKPTATAEMMHRTLGHLNDTYGGVRAYLLSTGLAPAELAVLRARLV